MKRILATLVFILFFNASLVSAITVGEYFEDREVNKDLAFSYLGGISDGYVYANAYLESVEKISPMYCQPRKLTLSGVMLDSMLVKHINDLSKNDQKKEMTISLPLSMLMMLQKVFPCSK